MQDHLQNAFSLSYKNRRKLLQCIFGEVSQSQVGVAFLFSGPSCFAVLVSLGRASFHCTRLTGTSLRPAACGDVPEEHVGPGRARRFPAEEERRDARDLVPPRQEHGTRRLDQYHRLRVHLRVEGAGASQG